MRSDSSSHSFDESIVSSRPDNSVTAAMNADNARSAKRVWSVYNELENDLRCVMMSLVSYPFFKRQLPCVGLGLHPLTERAVRTQVIASSALRPLTTKRPQVGRRP
jgi:hypothetical protein